jgi:hypothetical protein
MMWLFYDEGIPKFHLREQTPESLQRSFKRVLLDYFRRQLTFPTELLPALSGIANMIRQQTGDKYLAGL